MSEPQVAALLVVASAVIAVVSRYAQRYCRANTDRTITKPVDPPPPSLPETRIVRR